MNRIKELRKEKGLSLRTLGEMIGISNSALSHYENEKRMPDMDTLYKLGEILDASVDYITGHSDVRRYDLPQIESKTVDSVSADASGKPALSTTNPQKENTQPLDRLRLDAELYAMLRGLDDQKAQLVRDFLLGISGNHKD